MFYKILLALLAIFFMWQLFVYLRSNPQSLSKANVDRSFFVLGILALILIGFVAILVFLLK